MTWSELVEEIRSQVGGTQQARWVMEALAGKDSASRELNGDLVAKVRALATEVEAGKPLQYALGCWDFRSLTLVVDERALIPRPETEYLVDVALSAARELHGSLVAVDLGTGTGAIALAIATEAPGAEVHAVDQSQDALELARLNASKVGASVTFHHGSWWSAVPASLHGRVNLLISNPPYVTESEYVDLDIELSFEPKAALVAPASSTGVDGLGDLEAIINGASPFLANQALVVFECAPQQAKALKELSMALGSAEIIVDLAGRERGVLVRRST